MGASIEVHNLHKSYKNLYVLEDWNLSIRPSERVVLLGPSGAGKTSFLKMVAGLENPTRGTLEVHTRGMGYVFQEPRLIPWRTVRENLYFVNPRADISDLLEILRLQGFEDYFPAQLSGGMRQRVNLARALVVSPDLLILDEAFASLDLKVKISIMDDVMNLWHSRRFTIIAVTHDLNEALYLADRILIISGRPARIEQEFPVSLKGHRSYSSPELIQLQTELLNLVTE